MRAATFTCFVTLAALTPCGAARATNDSQGAASPSVAASPGVARDLGLWTGRLRSDKAAERRRGQYDLRRLSAGEASVLGQLAKDADVNVRVAAFDALTSWLRGDDEPRRAAALATMKELANGSEATASLAVARLDKIERDAEQEAIAEITPPANPALVVS